MATLYWSVIRMFNDISALANSFGIAFGLKGHVEFDGISDDSRLVLEVDEFHKKYISEEEAKEIFDLVTKAFIMGSKAEHHYMGATYEFDRENLTIIEHIDRDNRGEWL